MTNKPVHASADTLLAHFRKRVNLTIRELSAKLETPTATLNSVEYGYNGLSQELLNKIREVFPDEAAEIFSDYTPAPRGAAAQAQALASSPRAYAMLELETKAMNTVYRALEPLNEPTRLRVIEWVLNRLKQ